MSNTHQIKCRYCHFTCSSWYTSKNGNRHSGMRKLRRHVEDEHPEIANQIYLDPRTADETEELYQ